MAHQAEAPGAAVSQWELWSEVPGAKASACGTLEESETKVNTKGDKKI